ncbi:transcriptional regulator [Rarobacter faecitabidus]|uniref:Putative ArsR family transcriptional regulator n=1 Tax=Rarobacter faecitabidus TaxID=13243 RepID=A0A542ZVM3_RARFA|nr:HTH domain-containing protein [Rarobacter faecitabidus]TQL64296.1 putative ArsR family transcriptional regulator [Rarobacter faecitabidus]
MTENDLVESDASTHARVLELVIAGGPVTVAALASELGLTTAAIRRHIASLEASGRVQARDLLPKSRKRGRPARHYVATKQGQAELPDAYPDLAAQALHFLAHTAGSAAVEEFARTRLAEFEERYVSRITAADVAGRAEQLANLLTQDGYVASVRSVPGSTTLQLCQGHCPMQSIASEFPQFCEAEAHAISRLLGSHTQRLVTLANGGHVCTTTVPLGMPAPATPQT